MDIYIRQSLVCRYVGSYESLNEHVHHFGLLSRMAMHAIQVRCHWEPGLHVLASHQVFNS